MRKARRILAPFPPLVRSSSAAEQQGQSVGGSPKRALLGTAAKKACSSSEA